MKTEPLFSFELPRGLLRAFPLFQADTDRPALACTCMEIRKNGMHHELTLVATEGRRLVSYQTELQQQFLFGEFPDDETILADLSGCDKLPKGELRDIVTVEVFENEIGFVSEKIRYTTRRLEKDGITYPHWRGVIPSNRPTPVSAVTVNFELLADFGKAAKHIDHGMGLVLATFGDGMPISVQIANHREFFGIIMPMKNESAQAIPDWMLSEKERAEAVKSAA